MEPTEGSETSAIINQTPGNYPKGNLLYSVHGESLKSRIPVFVCMPSILCHRHQLMWCQSATAFVAILAVEFILR